MCPASVTPKRKFNMKYIIGNWKSHKLSSEIEQWAASWKSATAKLKIEPTKLQVVICPTLLGMPVLHQLLPNLALGSQGLSPYGDGSYTGAVSGRLVHEYAQFALLGHVERRKNFGETNQIVAQQAIQALDNLMTPIVAVDDANWSQQLSQFDQNQLSKMLVMYEPPEAISTAGTGHAADVGQVVQAIKLIQNEYRVMGVLYGGSVSPENVTEFLVEEVISGVVPGAASLDAKTLAALVTAATTVI